MNSIRHLIALGTLLSGLLLTSSIFATDCAPADITGDDDVNIDDIFQVIAEWGSDGIADIAPPGGNGTTDIDDLFEVLNAWGPTGFASGTFPAMWISGAPNCGSEPQIQMHQYNENTFILRQSMCTNFEGPFIYLLFGETKVLMQDTGASNIALASKVYSIINQWLIDHNQASIQLVVTHSHGHGDHIFCDSQFNGQPNTVVVGTSQTAVKNFFGITNWPTQIVQYDLGGGRIIDVIPIPGHQTAHIALYDRQTNILFTGDTLYPGRLYINNFTDYAASIQRMVDFSATNPVCHVLGTHIEMSNTPGDDYPIGSTSHPDEHPLQLTLDHLLELNEAVIAMSPGGPNAPPHIEVHDDFIVYPLTLFQRPKN
jgi:hydroxyacylglutathione hydrolase